MFKLRCALIRWLCALPGHVMCYTVAIPLPARSKYGSAFRFQRANKRAVYIYVGW